MRGFSLSFWVDAHPSPLPSASPSGLVTNRLGWRVGGSACPLCGSQPVPALALSLAWSEETGLSNQGMCSPNP